MAASIPFIKMHGLGNDFVVIDDLRKDSQTSLNAKLAQKICDRRFGIGADQILWLKRSENADCRMEILNSDGSSAEMCGNGIRAVALYLQKYGDRPSLLKYVVDTEGGEKTLTIEGDLVNVDMGIPRLGSVFKSGEQIGIEDQSFSFHEVGMGNPHAVIFVEKVSEVPLELWGRAIEKHKRFPNRTNVEFVEVVKKNHIRIRVWERGAGATLACGTGACAAAVTAIAVKECKIPLKVNLPGGDLEIRWAEGESVQMKGPAAEVFRGEYFPS